MARREQVFVRALNKKGEWDNIDIFDLDNDSFRAVIVNKLIDAGLLIALKDEIAGEEIILRGKGES